MQGSSTDLRRWSRVRRGVVALVATVVTTGLVTAGTAVAQQQPPGNGAELPPVDVVVLIDESESMSEADVAQEAAAARSVALSVLGPRSTFSAVGFASDDGGQSPVDLVCQQVPLDTQRNEAATCVNKVKLRTGVGNDTDHAEALREAQRQLAKGPNDRKLVLLMTDGALDVPDTAKYGVDRGPGNEALTRTERNEEALTQARGVLGELSRDGVQVWPVGFGRFDPAQLGTFVAGTPCAPGRPAPSVITAASPAELTQRLVDAYVAATCGRASEPTPPASVGPGGSATLTVEVPAIASDAAILVQTPDPKVSVSYVTPGGVEITNDRTDGPTVYTMSGQDTTTESLRVVNPEPGTWTVRLNGAPSGPDVPVTARVVYQGAVNLVVIPDTTAPTAGQDVGLTVQLRNRRGAITDPALLEGLTFQGALEVDGRPGAPVQLTDTNGDGAVEGSFPIPAGATGPVRFVARVVGADIVPREQSANGEIAATAPTVTGQARLDAGSQVVYPGDVRPGQVQLNNGSGQPVQVRVEVADPTPGAAITVVPDTVTVPPGAQSVPFELRFGDASALVPTQATLRLVDDAGRPIASQTPLSVDVQERPSVFEEFWWAFALLGLAVLGVLAWLVLRRKRERDRRRVRGLSVQLLRNGEPSGDLLAPVRPRDFTFPFSVADDGFVEPHLVALPVQRSSEPADGVFALSRDTRGNGIVLSPSGDRLASGDVRKLPGGMALLVRDGVAAGTFGGLDGGGFPQGGDTGWSTPSTGGDTDWSTSSTGGGTGWSTSSTGGDTSWSTPDGNGSWSTPEGNGSWSTPGTDGSWSTPDDSSWSTPTHATNGNGHAGWNDQPGGWGSDQGGGDTWQATRPTPTDNGGWGSDQNWGDPQTGGGQGPDRSDDQWR